MLSSILAIVFVLGLHILYIKLNTKFSIIMIKCFVKFLVLNQ